MTTKDSIHKLTAEELDFLKSLIGKSICSIQSDTIALIPSKPELYSFYKWIEIILWDNLDAYNFNYEFDETYYGNDFIELRIDKIIKDRAAQNASISYAGEDNFIVNKIQVYGDLYTYHPSEDESIKLEKESVSNENIILLEDTKGKKIIIYPFFSYLDINVTMNENLISKYIDDDMVSLKHEIK